MDLKALARQRRRGREEHKAPSYRRLDADRIVETADRLRRRISERFPDSGLHRVSEELAVVAREAHGRYAALAAPILGLRVAVGLLIATLLVIELAAAWWLAMQREATSWSDLLQGMDAGLNSMILSAGAIVFLVTAERRLKRRRRLRALHELRVMAHVIEMHQLTKDPERLVFPGMATESSPEVTLTPFLLARYLDYCSEMLALIGNLAAVVATGDDDQVTLAAVDAIEALTAGISQKIWQKMMIVNALARGGDVGQP